MTDHIVDANKMVSLKPLPELVFCLRDEAPYGNLDGGTKRELHLIDAAYRAGADQELDACCEWIYQHFQCGLEWSKDLRVARRPKPPSLKELALAALHGIHDQGPTPEQVVTIRRALEALDD